MPQSNQSFNLDGYRALWAQTIASVMSQFAGATLTATSATGARDSGHEGRWIQFKLSGALSGEQAFWVPVAGALHLAQLFMSEPVSSAAELTADHGDALSELFRQFAGSVATQLKSILGSECSFEFKEMKVGEASGSGPEITLATDPPVAIAMKVDTALEEAVSKYAQTSPSVSEVLQANSNVTEEAVAVSTTINGKNLDLLLDVELDVSIRFGQRHIALKDLLELSSGAVIELDRRTQDPIELILGGRVIAHGEAVVVDGNYGIRITEVISPTQRLALA